MTTCRQPSPRHRRYRLETVSLRKTWPLPRSKEIEHPLLQECGGVRVVRRQGAVGEVVLVAGIEKQLRVLGLLDERASGVDVTLIDEEWVGIHPMYLYRYPVRPRRPEL